MEITRQTVGMAELKTGGAGNVLVTLGLGSCVVVALYEGKLKKGALIHVMLPKKAYGRRRPGENLNKYADVAIPAAVEMLEKKGGRRSYITAKIAGGSHMFDMLIESHGDIGRRNVEAVKDILKSMKIPLIAEDTGGGQGRSVEFRIDTGEFFVRTVNGEERRI